MRRRVLLLVIGVTALTIGTAAVLLTLLVHTLVEQSWQSRTDDAARVVARAVAEYVELGRTPTSHDLSLLIRQDAQVSALLPDGREISTGPVDADTYFRSTATVGQVSATVGIPRTAAMLRFASISRMVLLCSLLAFAVGLVGAWFYSRRLVRPLAALTANTARLASGDTRGTGVRYGIVELDAIAEVVDRGVSSFNDLLEGERQLTANVSHQLRTPLTALSLRLEEIIAADDLADARDEAAQALGQVERLAGVAADLVAVARGARVSAAGPVQVDRLVRDATAEWAPLYRAAERTLEHEGVDRLVAYASYGAQSQVLATLVENSLRHGAGTTRIRGRAANGWVVIEVSDEGPGVPNDLAPCVFERHVTADPENGNGLGLTLARTLAAADGGRLQLVRAQPPVFALFLPAAAADPAPAESEPEAQPAESADSSARSALASASGNTHLR